MKKLLIITNLSWLSLGLLFGFKPQPHTRNLPPRQCAQFCYSYGNQLPTGLITYAQASMMASNYKNTMATGDAQAIWLSLETMKKFIYRIEQTTCRLNCNSSANNNLGLRFYYGRYPNNLTTFTGVPSNYINKHTLFIVPTFKQGSNHVDFDPLSQATTPNNCTLSSIKEKAPATNAIMMVMSGTNQNGIQNHGCLAPPDCNQGAAFIQ